MQHESIMQAAIAEANKAGAIGEVPIGAVAVRDGEIITRAHNLREATNNPLGHAEVLLIDQLAKRIGSWRLDDIALYVTCEPCLMCSGAILQARIPQVIFGCYDPKAGACGSLYEVLRDERLNHQVDCVGGVCGEECGALLSDFFRSVRERKS